MRGRAGDLSQNIPNHDNFCLKSTDLPPSYMRQMLASTQRGGSRLLLSLQMQFWRAHKPLPVMKYNRCHEIVVGFFDL